MPNGENIHPPADSRFDDIADIVSMLVDPLMVTSSDDDGESEFPSWDGSIRSLYLEADVAAEAGLPQSVRARVSGDSQMGFALILRPRNLLNWHSYGFYFQPSPLEGRNRGLEICQGPTRKHKRGETYWGFDLLDPTQVLSSSPGISKSLIRSLRRAHLRKGKFLAL